VKRKEPFQLQLLPPSLDFAPLAYEIGRANHQLGRLDGIIFTLPNPALLTAPLLTKEAVLSSRIEGTQASLEDVFNYEADHQRSEESETERDIREIINYRRALRAALKVVKKKPIGENLIKTMHSVLLDSVRGSGKDRGNFRRSQVYIAKDGAPIDQATFVPPIASDIPALISNWEQFLHAEDQIDPLVKVAILHYQFEAIHPFLDGNGRIGRLLIPLTLFSGGLLSHPLLYISEYFEENRQTYYDLLLAVSERQAWAEWIRFFLVAISTQSARAETTVKKIHQLHASLKDQVAAINSPYALRFLDLIFTTPVFSFNSIKDELGTKAQQTVYNLIDKFVDKGMIRERGVQKRNRRFEFPALLAILS
jgi:Fic family protein